MLILYGQCGIMISQGGNTMPMSSKDMERLILADGWVLTAQVGSHRQYIHPTKKGKVTIPFHSKDLRKGTEISILKQAGLK